MKPIAALPPLFREKIIFAPSGCWIWTAYRNQDGYAICSIKHVVRRAHRFAYTILVGPIPEGLTLDHLCRVRRCVKRRCGPCNSDWAKTRIRPSRSKVA